MTQARDLADGKFDTDTLVVDAANNRVGIGESVPDLRLHLKEPSGGNTTVLRLEHDGNNVYLNFQNDTRNDGYVGYDSTGNMEFWTANSERMTLLAGGGITFNGDTAAANALNDYEEGTVSSISDNSNASLTFTLNHARYRKVGDIVNFELDFQFPTTSNTNTNSIICLPFNAAVYGNAAIGYSTYGSHLTALAISGTKSISFYNSSGAALTNANLSGVRLILSITYQTND